MPGSDVEVFIKEEHGEEKKRPRSDLRGWADGQQEAQSGLGAGTEEGEGETPRSVVIEAKRGQEAREGWLTVSKALGARMTTG